MHDYESDHEEAWISKTQVKREAESLKELGRKILQLSPKLQVEFSFEGEMATALEEWKRLSSRDAQRRHVQRVGKLLRELDVASIQATLDRVDPHGPLAHQRQMEAQNWRERLIEEGAPALTSFIEKFPKVDIQSLRQSVRNSAKERKLGRSQKHAKDLLKIIREQM